MDWIQLAFLKQNRIKEIEHDYIDWIELIHKFGLFDLVVSYPGSY